MARTVTAPRHLQSDVVHVVIPDTQARFHSSTDTTYTAHLGWIAKYITEKFTGRPNVKIIHLGDHWDMPSLSSYDRKGGRLMEGRRYTTDIRYGNEAWHTLVDPMEGLGFDCHFLYGNHEERIVRAGDQDAQLDGLVDLSDLAVHDTPEWKQHKFLDPITLDGVMYAHYFANRMTGRPLSGQSMDARIKTIGRSFTMGHQQGLWFGRREVVGGQAHLGLVAGSCYLHDEDYLGPQGNDHWRGIIICYDVRRGDYDPKFVSLGSLCKRYMGKTLPQFMGRH